MAFLPHPYPLPLGEGTAGHARRDTDFTHTALADPSGNALGPFTLGQVVKLRTRVTNANGTTIGSIRRLTFLNPAH